MDNANDMFQAAKYSGAETRSPYEYFCAQIYLEKAKEEMERGNKHRAIEYWSKAYDMAQIAYKNAKRYRRAQ